MLRFHPIKPNILLSVQEILTHFDIYIGPRLLGQFSENLVLKCFNPRLSRGGLVAEFSNIIPLKYRYWFDLLIGQRLIFLNFESTLQVFVMTAKAVLNMDTCVVKAVLFLLEYGYLSLNFALHGLSCPPPPNTVRVNHPPDSAP